MGNTRISFLRHLVLNTIVLPRQARDKHEEQHSKKEVCFSAFFGVFRRPARALGRAGYAVKNAFFCGGI